MHMYPRPQPVDVIAPWREKNKILERDWRGEALADVPSEAAAARLEAALEDAHAVIVLHFNRTDGARGGDPGREYLTVVVQF